MSNNLSAIPSVAFAEVSDKLLTITRIWIEGVIIGWIGFFCSDVSFMVWNTLFADYSFFIGTYGLISDPYGGLASYN